MAFGLLTFVSNKGVDVRAWRYFAIGCTSFANVALTSSMQIVAERPRIHASIGVLLMTGSLDA